MSNKHPVPRPDDTRRWRKFYRRQWRLAMRRHGRWPVKVQEVVPAEEKIPELVASGQLGIDEGG